MASTEGPARAHDRHGRRRPFSNWMKRLANLKNSNTTSNNAEFAQKRTHIPMTVKNKKTTLSKNNPYPLSCNGNGHLALSDHVPSHRSQHSSLSQSKPSISVSHDSHNQSKSRAPTLLSATAETAASDAATSKAGTSATAGNTSGDRDSTFSSPAHSIRSMTTTLTTVQSAALPIQNPAASHPSGSNAITTTSSSMQPPSTTFSHQFPPATALPAHLAPHPTPGHPTTYTSATANNLLTDDASILTLASSSKRRRRNSVDTNASIRALAPASMFGGSRESLPLSVLSSTIIHPSNASISEAPGVLGSRNAGIAAERASLISSSGIAPALASDRNSYLGGKRGEGDGASVRSGPLGGSGGGHGRSESVTGSIAGGGVGSPLASPVISVAPERGRVSRQGSAALVEHGMGDEEKSLDGAEAEVMGGGEGKGTDE